MVAVAPVQFLSQGCGNIVQTGLVFPADGDYCRGVLSRIPGIGLGKHFVVETSVRFNNHSASGGGCLEDPLDEFERFRLPADEEIVRRTAEDKPRGLTDLGESRCPMEYVGSDQSALRRDANGGDILLDHPCGWQMAFDKDGPVCPATDCLDCHGAGSGKEIDGPHPPNGRSEQIENGFPRSVLHRPHALVTPIGEFSATKTSPDDPQPDGIDTFSTVSHISFFSGTLVFCHKCQQSVNQSRRTWICTARSGIPIVRGLLRAVSGIAPPRQALPRMVV